MNGHPLAARPSRTIKHTQTKLCQPPWLDPPTEKKRHGKTVTLSLTFKMCRRPDFGEKRRFLLFVFSIHAVINIVNSFISRFVYECHRGPPMLNGRALCTNKCREKFTCIFFVFGPNTPGGLFDGKYNRRLAEAS